MTLPFDCHQTCGTTLDVATCNSTLELESTKTPDTRASLIKRNANSALMIKCGRSAFCLWHKYQRLTTKSKNYSKVYKINTACPMTLAALWEKKSNHHLSLGPMRPKMHLPDATTWLESSQSPFAPQRVAAVLECGQQMAALFQGRASRGSWVRSRLCKFWAKMSQILTFNLFLSWIVLLGFVVTSVQSL